MPDESKFIVFGQPLIEQPEIDEVVDSMVARWIGTGPKVQQFERRFAEYKRVSPDLVAAVNSCTAAMHVSLIASGIGPGDEVITTAMTFASTVNAIIHAGASPVLADAAPGSMNIDLQEVEDRISERTRAILPVHFAGNPLDTEALSALADKHGLKIIEDCAHAIETESGGVKAGTASDFGCFSFYATKNVTTGEGGMVIAKRAQDINRIKRLALHGLSQDAWHRYSDKGFKHYRVTECGFKYNMMDLQAAIGIHQLSRVEENWKVRRHIWKHYQEELSDLPLTLPAEPDAADRHAYHLFPILIDPAAPLTRDQFMEKMTEHRIGVGVHYLSIPEHPCYQERFDWKPGDYPVASDIGQRTVSIPLQAGLPDADVDRIVATVRSLLS